MAKYTLRKMIRLGFIGQKGEGRDATNHKRPTKPRNWKRKLAKRRKIAKQSRQYNRDRRR